MARTILAVAIGLTNLDRRIDNAANLSGVRPYIPGLVHKLTALRVQIGTDYVIDYRERIPTDLDSAFNALSADLIFGMSTTVVLAAQRLAGARPIVGVVSDPGREGVAGAQNICGISARRSQTARQCAEHFLATVPGLTDIRALIRANYNPTDAALRAITHPALPGATVTPVPVTASNIESVLRGLTVTPGSTGILVLPADVCFAAAPLIIDIGQNVKRVPTFFPVTDWVRLNLPSAVGGYGVPQEKCGELMAERVADIWQTGQVNAPRWRDAPNGEFKWLGSDAAATGLNITLPGNVPRAVQARARQAGYE